MDYVLDTNIVLRAADRAHPMCRPAKRAMVALVRKGVRLCITEQSLVETWMVATRPRDVNGHGVRHILTCNEDDFKRYVPNIEVVRPEDVSG